MPHRIKTSIVRALRVPAESQERFICISVSDGRPFSVCDFHACESPTVTHHEISKLDLADRSIESSSQSVRLLREKIASG